MRPPLTAKPGQAALRELLIASEKEGSLVSIQDIVAATGWKTSTVRTYVSKMLRSHLHLAERGAYSVTGIRDLEEQGFLRLLSQSRRRRETPMKLRDPLARALVAKARENMLLALEIYNRPTLANRLDSFTQIFCTAWKQLMKAELQERAPDSIFRPAKLNRQRRETIGFNDCLKALFPENSPVRQNLADIQELRDESTHLLMRELQPLASLLFQSGVLNFAKRYLSVCDEALVSGKTLSLMSLVLTPPPLNPVHLKEVYGSATARDILTKAQEMEAKVIQGYPIDYAFPLGHEIVLTKKPGPHDIRLSLTDLPVEADAEVIFVKKPTDVSKDFRYRLKDLRMLLSEHFHREFSNHEMLAMIEREKFKSANNEFHYHYEISRTHGYSEACLNRLKNRISQDPDYVQRCVDSYNRRPAKRKQ